MISKEKSIIRKNIKQIKSKYSLQQKKGLSIQILEKIETLPEFINAKTIMMYWSMDDEVYTHKFVEKWSQSKAIILPSVQDNILLLKEYKGANHLVAGEKYGIPEPQGVAFNKPKKIDVIIVPGIAFDKLGNRMGRGKGYYDNLLKSSNAIKIGICFPFQIITKVPCELHDVKMDIVISG